MRAAFHEVMATHVCHDLRTREDLLVELRFDLVKLLQNHQKVCSWNVDTAPY